MSRLTDFDALPQETFSFAGHTVTYRTAGPATAAEPILLIHGWPFHGAVWRDLVADLKDSHRLYIIDLPGAGSSQPPADGVDLFRYAADAVRAMVDHAGLDRFGLVGFDSGAAIARFVAATYGNRVTGLVMGNTEIPGHTPKSVLLMQRLARRSSLAWLFSRMLASDAYCRSKYGFGGCFYDRSRITDRDGDFYRAFIEPLRFDARPAMKVLADADLDSLSERLTDAHGKLTCPVHLVWGARDPFFPVRHLHRLESELPTRVETVIREDAALLVHEEHPDVFADVCRRAFANTASARAA